MVEINPVQPLEREELFVCEGAEVCWVCLRKSAGCLSLLSMITAHEKEKPREQERIKSKAKEEK